MTLLRFRRSGNPQEWTRQQAVREHIERAHIEVRRAQDLAYQSEDLAPRRVRLALNKAQSTLIKLLVHQLRGGGREPR